MSKNKYKLEYSLGQRVIVIKSEKGQQISEREYYSLNTGQFPFLVGVSLARKGSGFRLTYNISGFLTLREYLMRPISKASFTKLLDSILTALEALRAAYYSRQAVIFDIDAVMVDPSSHMVCFIYVPIAFYESETDMRAFFLNIIQACSFFRNESTEYVREYIRILNSGINFSLFELEEYVKGLNASTISDDVRKKCTVCGAILVTDTPYCSFCGAKITEIPMSVESTGSLVCLSTQRTVRITSDIFTIGKDSECDFTIADNPAVSRTHAMIKHVNNRWLINDLNSTNKTYINGRVISPHDDVELFDGASIRLANEELIFKLL